MKLQKLGGWTSILLAWAHIPMGILIGVIEGALGTGDNRDPSGMLAGYQPSTIAFHSFYILCLVEGILSLLIALSLQERMQTREPNLMKLAVIAASIALALSLTAMAAGYVSDGLIAGGDMAGYRSSHALLECVFAASGNAWGWAVSLIG